MRRAFTGLTDAADQLKAFEAAGARSIIITRGSQGLLAADQGKRWRCGAYQMDVVDPSGSGDAFAAGIIRSLIEDWDMPRTLRYGAPSVPR